MTKDVEMLITKKAPPKIFACASGPSTDLANPRAPPTFAAAMVLQFIMNLEDSNGVNFEPTPKLMMFSRVFKKLESDRSHKSGNWSEVVP